MPFLNIKRTVVPTDITLPVSAQTAGSKAANFFPGWDSPAGEVFTFQTPNGEKKFAETALNGKIAVKTTAYWRDAEVTTYAHSFNILLRLTDAGKAWLFRSNANVPGGFFAIDEVSGINQALPIFSENSPANGISVREVVYENGTLVSKFGPGGSVVDAGYSTAWAAGHAFTLGITGFRIYVKFKGVLIFDLPYEAWTHMEAGRIALAPTTNYGMLDSSVDFLPLAAIPSVRDGIANPSDLSNPSVGRCINLYDLNLKRIRQNGCSITAGSTTLTVPSTSVWAVGDQGIVEAGQVAFTVTPGGGNTGNGTFVAGCPYLSNDIVHNNDIANWQTGNWIVTFTSASSYTVTRPNASNGGTGATDCRYNDGITFQIMAGSTPFANGDTFTIACAASGETATSTFDGKPAAGRNRTIGVGGVKPVHALTQAQLDAGTNLGYAADTLAYISNNTSGNQGRVVYCGGGGIYELLTDPYQRYSRPQALYFTVEAVLSPTTLQISTAASATTANATVWFDAAPAFARVITSTDFNVYNDVEVRIPAGDYAASEPNAINGVLLNMADRTGWKLRGEGIDVTNLYQPRGVDGGFMQVSSWEDGGDEAISDFSVYGNDHPNGGYARQINPDPNIPTQIPTLVQLLGPFSTSINRIKTVNARGQSLDVNQGHNSFIRNCIAIRTVPALNYSGWVINMSDCNDAAAPCGLIDNIITCSWFHNAHETFSSESGTISGFDITNGLMSTNSSNGYTIADGTFTFTKNCWFTGFSIESGPALSVGSNQEHTLTVGGSITNVNFIYEGYLTEANTINNAITIESSPSPGVVMDGTYNPLVADDGNRKGLISRPNWITGNELNGAAIIVADGAYLTLTNYRLIGVVVGGSFVEQVHNQNGDITVNSCILDTGVSGLGGEHLSGNVTNAAYDAL